VEYRLGNSTFVVGSGHLNLEFELIRTKQRKINGGEGKKGERDLKKIL
jgi:hypothetical protein